MLNNEINACDILINFSTFAVLKSLSMIWRGQMFVNALKVSWIYWQRSSYIGSGNRSTMSEEKIYFLPFWYLANKKTLVSHRDTEKKF